MNCRFKTIRQEMKTTSGFIICNQDLLTTHLDQMMFKQQESPLLSKDIRFVVVDEAHNLEDIHAVKLTGLFGKLQNNTIKILEYL